MIEHSQPVGFNTLVDSNRDIFELLSSSELSGLLVDFNYQWQSNHFNQTAELLPFLRARGLIDDNINGLTRAGILFLSRLLLHFKPSVQNAETSLNEKYERFAFISAGKNAIVFKAYNRFLNTPVVLKIIRPGASEDITHSLRILSNVRRDTALVLPIDYIAANIKDVFGKELTVDCLVFPFVEGKTLRNFLSQENHRLNSQVALAFAKQISEALLELENVGAYHGDLHEQNILVDETSPSGLSFRIVDISFDSMGSTPGYVCRNNDLLYFKQHIWRILAAQRASLPMLSIRKYLGTRSYIRLAKVLSTVSTDFHDVCQVLNSDQDFKAFIQEREKFIEAEFSSPVSFRLQRYEEITDATVAVKLFVPFKELMTKIKSFANIYVSGNRGSGKSTYLAALAFFPDTDGSLVDFEETFGVYFPCRQGEFKPLGSRPNWDVDDDRAIIARLIVVKIIRTTLQAVSTGLSSGKLIEPSDIKALREFVSRFVPPPGIVSVARDIQSEIDNLVSTMVRVEMTQVGNLSSAIAPANGDDQLRLTLEFFGILRETVPQLSRTQFHLLFDDAGTPFVPSNVQAVLCELMLLSNPLFCVKISAEKKSFNFRSADGKQLELGQDYLEHDISQVLFIGSDRSNLRRNVLEDYFHTIVLERLKYFGYESTDIVDYLGDNQIPYSDLLDRLAKGRRDAYYCGWTTVWNVADRTPRNLLEIVSEIFAAGEITRVSSPQTVSVVDQNRAIRVISEKRLDSLSQISGAIKILGTEVSLGRKLFEVTTAIGSTFRKYLRDDKDLPNKREHLAIERNDLADINDEANKILDSLITFGVLDATKLEYSRDDQARKPIYVLNRIYCPIFGIGYRRDTHLRLSRKKLELLLLAPGGFLARGTDRLVRLGDGSESNLFTYRRML